MRQCRRGLWNYRSVYVCMYEYMYGVISFCNSVFRVNVICATDLPTRKLPIFTLRGFVAATKAVVGGIYAVSGACLVDISSTSVRIVFSFTNDDRVLILWRLLILLLLLLLLLELLLLLMILILLMLLLLLLLIVVTRCLSFGMGDSLSTV